MILLIKCLITLCMYMNVSRLRSSRKDYQAEHQNLQMSYNLKQDHTSFSKDIIGSV